MAAMARTCFHSLHSALVRTLVDTYTDNADVQALKNFQWLQSDEDLVVQWWDDLSVHIAKVESHDVSLFLEPIPCLQRLQIPQLWNAGEYTVNSKRYLWQYLESITRHAKMAICDVSTGDIAPPSSTGRSTDLPTVLSEGLASAPALKKIYEQIPQGILQKVQAVAEKYGENMQRGDKSMEDFKFDDVSQELFQALTQEDMEGLVSNVSQALESFAVDLSSGDHK